MRIELINTGTELLLGDVVNTNAAWLGRQLAALGLQLARVTMVPDGAAIKDAIAEAAARCDVLLVSGGLGPTNDDITREATAEILGLPLVQSPEETARLEAYFAKRNKTVAAANLRQAMVPVGAHVMPNDFGTAPGLYFPSDLAAARGCHCHIFLLPGPPRELQPMMERHVEQRLRGMLPNGRDRRILYLKLSGIGESEIVEAVEKDLEAIPDLDLGYCIGRGDVDVRLAGSLEVVARGTQVVRNKLASQIVSEDRRLLEEVVVQFLADRGEWLATAESCTGGFLASRVTDVSGASAVFGHGFITYANAAKQRCLGVPASLLEEFGAVSEPVASAMAEGCLLASAADHALAVTGIAGPSGGTEAKPVGTVFIGLASKGQPTLVRRCLFPTTRDRFKILTTQAALDLLRLRLRDVSLTA